MRLLLILVGLMISTAVWAQSGVSPNLVYMTTNPYPGTAGTSPGSWSNTFDVTTSNGGGVSGGSRPGYNSTTGTFMFGYTTASVAYTYAFSQALQNSGMTILGYNYSWQYYNQGYSSGTLSAAVNFAATNGTSLHSKNWSLGTTQDWTTISGTETFSNPGLLASSIANFSLSFTGKDNRWWAGYYGPQVKNPSLTLNYTFDVCSSNPLSSPDCPGYAQAYFTQQCTANPLYNSACPGYQQAYYNQQCTANPLYDAGCPGYAQAYFDQQCTANPLYNTQCPGYAQAYFTQQCTANPLYNIKCPGYAQAYFTQQCTANPLYNTQCPGYARAYYDQQCSLNGLYDRNCPNYATAYATQQLTSKTNTTTVTTTTVSDPVTAQTNPVAAQTNPVAVATTTANTTSSTSPTSVTSVTSVVAPAPAPQAPTAAPDATSKDTTKDTAKDSPAAPAPAPAASSSEPRSADSGRRDDRQNARASADARAREVMRQAGDAKTLEAQAATQTAALALMGFVPGFEAYSQTRLPDPLMQQLQQKYGRSPVDNRRALWGLTGPSEQRWNQMVEDQFEIAK